MVRRSWHLGGNLSSERKLYDFEKFEGYPEDENEWKEYYKKAGMTKGYLLSGGLETLAEFRADKRQLDDAMT